MGQILALCSNDDDSSQKSIELKSSELKYQHHADQLKEEVEESNISSEQQQQQQKQQNQEEEASAKNSTTTSATASPATQLQKNHADSALDVNTARTTSDGNPTPRSSGGNSNTPTPSVNTDHGSDKNSAHNNNATTTTTTTTTNGSDNENGNIIKDDSTIDQQCRKSEVNPLSNSTSKPSLFNSSATSSSGIAVPTDVTNTSFTSSSCPAFSNSSSEQHIAVFRASPAVSDNLQQSGASFYNQGNGFGGSNSNNNSNSFQNSPSLIAASVPPSILPIALFEKIPVTTFDVSPLTNTTAASTTTVAEDRNNNNNSSQTKNSNNNNNDDDDSININITKSITSNEEEITNSSQPLYASSNLATNTNTTAGTSSITSTPSEDSTFVQYRSGSPTHSSNNNDSNNNSNNNSGNISNVSQQQKQNLPGISLLNSMHGFSADLMMFSGSSNDSSSAPSSLPRNSGVTSPVHREETLLPHSIAAAGDATTVVTNIQNESEKNRSNITTKEQKILDDTNSQQQQQQQSSESNNNNNNNNNNISGNNSQLPQLKLSAIGIVTRAQVIEESGGVVRDDSLGKVSFPPTESSFSSSTSNSVSKGNLGVKVIDELDSFGSKNNNQNNSNSGSEENSKNNNDNNNTNTSLSLHSTSSSSSVGPIVGAECVTSCNYRYDCSSTSSSPASQNIYSNINNNQNEQQQHPFSGEYMESRDSVNDNNDNDDDNSIAAAASEEFHERQQDIDLDARDKKKETSQERLVCFPVGGDDSDSSGSGNNSFVDSWRSEDEGGESHRGSAKLSPTTTTSSSDNSNNSNGCVNSGNNTNLQKSNYL